MPRPRVVALDMDGCLCTSSKHPTLGVNRVSPDTRAALEQFVEAGGVVVVATGRPAPRATEVLDRDLPGTVSYCVVNDGSAVLAAPDWETIWTRGLGSGAAASAIDMIEAAVTGPSGAAGGCCHFGVQLLHARLDDGSGAYGSVVSSERVIVLIDEAKPSWAETIRTDGRLAKYGHPPVLPDLRAKLRRGLGFFGEGSADPAANPQVGLATARRVITCQTPSARAQSQL